MSSAPPASSTAPATTGRRPALDGLRALAVVAVVVYHFGNGADSPLPGGYLGVDIFFVLSGYLITGLLIGEYEKRGRIDLLGFWVRRLRRLLPALVALLLAVTAWIWWATPPDSYPQRRADILWTLGYAANWHLINTSETYFASYTAASPLRHTWSLSIEEQFYLLWPALVLILLTIGAVRRRGLTLVAAVAVAGTGLSVWWMATRYDPVYPSQDYFSTRSRVQELFVGVLLAVLVPVLRKQHRSVRVLAGAGLLGVLVSLVLLPDDTAFFYRGGALLFSLAVAAVIAGVELRPTGVAARVFSLRPAVALGRISYGVYLWHWPLVVAIPVTAGMPAGETAARQVLRLAITLAAATASYFLIEQPVLRSRRLFRSRPRAIGAALAATALVVAVALPATALPGTVSAQLTLHSDTACPGERNDHWLVCTLPATQEGAPVRLALMGDSTGRALGPGLNAWADRTDSTWVDAAWKLCTVSGLLILPGNAGPDSAATFCHDQAPGLIDEALATYRPPVVLVSEYWIASRTVVVNGKKVKAGTPEHDAALRAGYLSLVDRVAAYGGRVVFLELPPPGEPLGTVVAQGRPAGNARAVVSGSGYVDGFNAVLRSVATARPDSARTVTVTDLVCPRGKCAPLQGDMLVRFDGVHYTVRFSRYLVPVLMERIGLSG